MRALALILALCPVIGCAGGLVPQTVVLYKDAARPLAEQKRNAWLAPAAAYTALTAPAQFDVLAAHGAQVHSAQALIVWQANSAGGNTGAGIFVCPAQPHAGTELLGCAILAYFAASDSGPAAYTPGCTVNPGGPFPCRLDVTEALRAFLLAGTPGLYYVGVAYGNGANGPAIYDIELFINWLVP